jgi:hypothetical protein
LTVWDWVAIAGRLVVLLCALGILVSAIARQKLILPFGSVACVGAAINLVANIGRAAAYQQVRWSKTVIKRSERPTAYWFSFVALVVTLALYVLAALKIVSLIS